MDGAEPQGLVGDEVGGGVTAAFAWVEGELRQALITARRLPGRGALPAALRSLWPSAPRGWREYNTDPTRMARPLASPDEVERMDRALGWLQWLTPRDRDLVLAKAGRVSFGAIAKRDGRTSEGCRYAYRAAVRTILARIISRGLVKLAKSVP